MPIAEETPGPSKPHSSDEEDNEIALKNSIKEGNFVLVNWNSMAFPGVVNSIDKNGAVVDCMQRCKKGWKWPTTKDVMHYKWIDIKKKINPPKLLKRGIFGVPNVPHL